MDSDAVLDYEVTFKELIPHIMLSSLPNQNLRHAGSVSHNQNVLVHIRHVQIARILQCLGQIDRLPQY